MPKKKTHEQYIEEVARINNNIEVLEIYQGSNTPILHKCKIDGYEWLARPNSILSNCGCPKCAKHVKMSTDEYKSKVLNINKNIYVIGEYVDMREKILHKCAIDGTEWYATPDHILRGSGCPVCGGTARKTHEQYVNEVSKLNSAIEVVGRYVSRKTPILHRCKIDNFEWMALPDNILCGEGCPVCKMSHGEKKIYAWLKENGFNFIQQKTFDDCRRKKLLPFDFYLPDYNMCIEYDGEQHFMPVEYFGGINKFLKQVETDNIKTEYCNKNCIQLLRIKYDQNIEMILESGLSYV